ncbi:MAG: bifunctional DNA primase/polymerase, partial [bacterium]|nr:bifunctional DNA primase/polymerase [bacterium]
MVIEMNSVAVKIEYLLAWARCCHEYLNWVFTPLRFDKEGKKPIRADWQSEPRLDWSIIEAHIHAGGNIGLRTGQASGIVAVDIDEGADLDGLDLPETVTVRTGSGGWHLYYAYDQPLHNSVGKLAEHIDIRADRGQVVFPGSIHPDTGEPYVFTAAPWDVDLAPLPAWIIERCQAPKDVPGLPPTPSPPAASESTGYVPNRAAFPRP